MKFRDFKGKLNNHEEYIKILSKLELKSKYIEIVISEENEMVNLFKNNIIKQLQVNKWWGTNTTKIKSVYKIKTSKELFDKLKGYETFCRYYESTKGDYAEMTNFSDTDIAFFDELKDPLLYTTSHEGYVTIREDLLT